MLLYKDTISGDEMFSDAFKITEIEDIAFEVDCKMINVKQGADVDIGGNPSAEGMSVSLYLSFYICILIYLVIRWRGRTARGGHDPGQQCRLLVPFARNIF